MCHVAQRGWDSYIVYLFDKSITTYSGPFSARQLPDKVNTIGQFTVIIVLLSAALMLCCMDLMSRSVGRSVSQSVLNTSCVCFALAVQEAKTQLPLVVLKKVWGEAVSYICGLKEDYSRLFQGQRAAM